MSNDENNGVRRFLTLTLEEEYFALDISAVREILDMTDLTKVPQMPSYMPGLVDVRGMAVPVIDLRLKFGMEEGERTVNTRIVILEFGEGEDMSVVGAIADSVKEVLELDDSAIGPPPNISGSKADFLAGISRHNDKFIMLLDMGKVFTSDEVLALDALQGGMPRETAQADEAAA